MQVRSEKVAKVGQEGRWIVELAPGHPDHPPTRSLETPVAFPVRLEGDTCSVCPAAVKLGDQPLLSPQAVGFDFETVDVQKAVEFGPW